MEIFCCPVLLPSKAIDKESNREGAKYASNRKNGNSDGPDCCEGALRNGFLVAVKPCIVDETFNDLLKNKTNSSKHDCVIMPKMLDELSLLRKKKLYRLYYTVDKLKTLNDLGVSVQLVAALYSYGRSLTPRNVTSHHEVSYYFTLPPLYTRVSQARITRPTHVITLDHIQWNKYRFITWDV